MAHAVNYTVLSSNAKTLLWVVLPERHGLVCTIIYLFKTDISGLIDPYYIL
jgi:hypothetical protein